MTTLHLPALHPALTLCNLRQRHGRSDGRQECSRDACHDYEPICGKSWCQGFLARETGMRGAVLRMNGCRPSYAPILARRFRAGFDMLQIVSSWALRRTLAVGCAP